MKDVMSFLSVSNSKVKQALLKQNRWNHLFNIQFIEKDGYQCVLFKDHYDPEFSFRTSPITGIVETHYLDFSTVTIKTKNSEYVLF